MTKRDIKTLEEWGVERKDIDDFYSLFKTLKVRVAQYKRSETAEEVAFLSDLSTGRVRSLILKYPEQIAISRASKRVEYMVGEKERGKRDSADAARGAWYTPARIRI